MFKDLRINAPFYILDKGDKVNLQTGSIISVSQPAVKPNSNFNAGIYQQPEYIVDIQVKVGDETMDFKQLPANTTLADFSSNNQKIVVSGSRDMISAEVESTITDSKSIVDSIQIHQNKIVECEKILKEINPSFAKDKEQEETIKSLQGKIISLEDNLVEIKNLILAQNKQPMK